MVVYLEPDKALACEIGISLALSNIDPDGGNNDMTDVVLALEVYSRAPHCMVFVPGVWSGTVDMVSGYYTIDSFDGKKFNTDGTFGLTSG